MVVPQFVSLSSVVMVLLSLVWARSVMILMLLVVMVVQLSVKLNIVVIVLSNLI